jgi:hypothetical protein
MKYEALVDYEQHEVEAFDRYLKGPQSLTVGYPPETRFRRLAKPVGLRSNHASLWPQIPLFGSLVVPLSPVEKAWFAEVHGFELRDLPRLMELSRDTGKVQFVLGASPTEFRGLDYLDEIFAEFNPPLIGFRGVDSLLEPNLFKSAIAEFDAAAATIFFDILLRWYGANGIDESFALTRYSVFRSTYAFMKYMGYERVCEQLIGDLAADPNRAHKILYIYSDHVVNPLLKTLPSVHCTSFEELSAAGRVVAEATPSAKSLVFPCEIGAFLLKRLIPIPESYESCMNIIGRYEQSDMYKMLMVLSQAIREINVDLAVTSSGNLEEALSNIWSDAQNLSKRISGLARGVNLGISAIGPIAGNFLAGVTGTAVGVLASLGFQVLDSTASGISERLARRVVESFSPNYLSAILDLSKSVPLR